MCWAVDSQSAAVEKTSVPWPIGKRPMEEIKTSHEEKPIAPYPKRNAPYPMKAPPKLPAKEATIKTRGEMRTLSGTILAENAPCKWKSRLCRLHGVVENVISPCLFFDILTPMQKKSSTRICAALTALALVCSVSFAGVGENVLFNADCSVLSGYGHPLGWEVLIGDATNLSGGPFQVPRSL